MSRSRPRSAEHFGKVNDKQERFDLARLVQPFLSVSEDREETTDQARSLAHADSRHPLSPPQIGVEWDGERAQIFALQETDEKRARNKLLDRK